MTTFFLPTTILLLPLFYLLFINYSSDLKFQYIVVQLTNLLSQK